MQSRTSNQIKMTYDCIPCAIGSLLKLFKNGVVPQSKQDESVRALLKYLSEIDLNQSPPELGREMHELIRHVIDNPDPYYQIKQKYNLDLLEKYPTFKDVVNRSKNPFQTAMRLAIAGNIIDFGPNHDFNVDETIKNALNATLSIDHSESLKTEIDKANSILYIADNAGEIVLDRLFIETIDHNNITLAVRGGPIINDVTEDDVRQVGLDEITNTISSGDNSPGTIMTRVNKEFESFFHNSDLIISKGQGNYEGLAGNTQNIYFMLMAKCDHVAEHLGVKTGDLVVVNEHLQ